MQITIQSLNFFNNHEDTKITNSQFQKPLRHRIITGGGNKDVKQAHHNFKILLD